MSQTAEMCPGVENYQGTVRRIPNIPLIPVLIDRNPDGTIRQVNCSMLVTGGFCHRPVGGNLPSDPGRSPLRERCLYLNEQTNSAIPEAPAVQISIQPQNTLAITGTSQLLERLRFIQLLNRRIRDLTPEIVLPTASPIDETNSTEGRDNPESTTTITEVQLKKGKEYQPFAKIAKLPDINWEEARRSFALDGYQTVVLGIPIRFRGIRGFIDLATYFYFVDEGQENDEYESASKPMGVVTLAVQRTFDSSDETVDEYQNTPLKIGLRFFPTTYEELEILEENRMEVSLDDDLYYLKCAGRDSDYDEDSFGNDQQVIVEDYETTDDSDYDSQAILPLDDSFRRIKVKIISEEEFQDL